MIEAFHLLLAEETTFICRKERERTFHEVSALHVGQGAVLEVHDLVSGAVAVDLALGGGAHEAEVALEDEDGPVDDLDAEPLLVAHRLAARVQTAGRLVVHVVVVVGLDAHRAVLLPLQLEQRQVRAAATQKEDGQGVIKAEELASISTLKRRTCHSH